MEDVRADPNAAFRITYIIRREDVMELEGMEDRPVYSGRARWDSRSYSGISDIFERFDGLGESYMYFDDDAFEADEDGDEYFDSDEETEEEEEEEEEEDEWKLQLPINGMIALRRFMERGEDPFTVLRAQYAQLQHEIADRIGPLRDVKIVFKELDYITPNQRRTRFARLVEGEPISPGSIPTLKQMNIKEYNEAYGIKFDLEKWLEHYDESVMEKFEFYSISDDEFLECNYFARRQSMPSEEAFFVENPFEGWPSSAPVENHQIGWD